MVNLQNSKGGLSSPPYSLYVVVLADGLSIPAANLELIEKRLLQTQGDSDIILQLMMCPVGSNKSCHRAQ